MIFGQWYGKISGQSNGEVLLSVDKQLEDQSGSIGVVPTDQTTLAMVCRVNFTKVKDQNIEGNLDRFLGFTKEGVVYPQSNAQIQLSNFGVVKMTASENENNQLELKGSWKTDLGYSGDVILWKVPPPKPSKVQEIITWEEFKQKISDPNRYKLGTFFRGQPDSKHPLQTYFHRMKCWDLYRFYNEVIPELFDHLGVLNNTRYPTAGGSDFGSPLLLAQHHGFPTPLLDWTLSPYVSAYFAFENIDECKKPKSIRVFAFHTDRWLSEQSQYAKGDIISPGLTIRPLTIPLAGNKRAVAQSARSVFSSIENIENVLSMALYPKVEGEVKEMPKDYFDYYDIAIEEKEKAMHDLSLMNITRLSLFPEVQAACDILKTKYFGK